MSQDSEDRAEKEMEAPVAKRCRLCGYVESNDPGFFILFAPNTTIYTLLENAGLQQINPVNPSAPQIPSRSATAPQSFQVLCQCLDDVALSVGMTIANFTLDASNARDDVH